MIELYKYMLILKILWLKDDPCFQCIRTLMFDVIEEWECEII